jgi:hypothetical protein
LRRVVAMLNMRQVTLPRTHRSICFLVATMAVAGALAGCLGEDQGQGVTIWNRTSASLDVNYRRIVGATEMEDLVMTIPSGQRVIVVGPHQAEGECIRGTLVAMQDGQSIAQLSQPCRGADWVITRPELFPSTEPPS